MRRIKSAYNQEEVSFSKLPIPKDDYDKICAALLSIPYSNYMVCLMDSACSSKIQDIVEYDGLTITCKRTQNKVTLNEIVPQFIRPKPIRTRSDINIFN